MTIVGDGTWTVGDEWPWPKVFFLRRYVLGVAIDNTGLKLYELSALLGNWNTTEVCRLGPLARILNVEVADFGRYYVVIVSGLNGTERWTALYARQPFKPVASGAVTAVVTEDIPHGYSGCNYKGQLIIGGIHSNHSRYEDLGQCSIAWGGIGSVEFDPGVDPSAGYMKMPWASHSRDIVYKVLRLGDNIMAYGNKGISRLMPTTIKNNISFGHIQLAEVGVLSGSAVNGDNEIHAFVDTNYDLWIGNAEKIENLGYRSFIQTLSNDRVIVSYDTNKKRFYISDGTLGFVLTQHGFYSTNQCLTSVGRSNNILCGITVDNGDDKIRLKTTATDFNQQGLKSIEGVECGVDYDTVADETVSISLSGQYDYKGDFVDLALITLNERGIGTQKMTAREFKITLQADYENGGEFKLSSLRTKVKFPDKRNIRGRLNVT